jgi:hypothetical protein
LRYIGRNNKSSVFAEVFGSCEEPFASRQQYKPYGVAKRMTEWTKRFLWLALNAAVWIGLMVVMLVRIHSDPNSGGLPSLLFATGALGAVLSTYRKLAEIPDTQEEADKTLRRTAALQIFVSPFIGGTFAELLWMMFFSGILQGGVFPKICGTEGTYTNWHDLMSLTRPCAYADGAKGIIWAFVAGYAEGFVPSVIDRLARESGKKG